MADGPRLAPSPVFTSFAFLLSVKLWRITMALITFRICSIKAHFFARLEEIDHGASRRQPSVNGIDLALTTRRHAQGSKHYIRNTIDRLCSIYKKVLDACRTSSSRLAKCLPPDDILLLHDTGDSLGTKGFDKTAVDQFAREKCREAMSRLEQSKIKWLSDATHSFASVAVHLSELLAPMVPQSPEYTIPFGCLTIIFQVIHYALSHGNIVLTETDLGCKTREA